MIVFYAGSYLDETEPALPLSNGGFMHGNGVFTTFKLERGRIRQLAAHQKRLAEQASKIGLPEPWGVESIPPVISELIKRNSLQGNGYRIRVSLTEQHRKTVLSIHPRTLPAGLAGWSRNGHPVVCLGPEYQRRFRPDLKTANYLPSVLALKNAASRGCPEALVFDEEGLLLEGAVSNVFLVVSGNLITPPADGRILAGITRRWVLETAGSQGISCQEASITREDLLGAEEVFLTNSVRGVMAVTRVNDSPVGPGQPGPLSRLFQALWAEIPD
jgi:branched-subunit amino acid aminotransferase/4-amino-4-deoxychorismate lyase